MTDVKQQQPSIDQNSLWLNADVPAELAQTFVVEYGEESLRKLADTAVHAAVANMQPSPSYADVNAQNLARDAVRYALGLKLMPEEQGEQ